jgi:predicted RND superfamily exporter protein
MGCCWILGFCGAMGILITPVSLCVAPVLLGIGVDDGLHALHGSNVHGGLAASLRKVGTAMTLTTMTTFVGFGSLLFSRVPALRGSGLLVAAGTLLCLLATLLLLPALETILSGHRSGDRARGGKSALGEPGS